MSAYIGINTGEAIHLLTDGAWVSPVDGIVRAISAKQSTMTRYGENKTIANFAWNGWPQAPEMFIGLATLSCRTFDDLADQAPDMWRSVVQDMPPPSLAQPSGDPVPVRYVLLFAGYSDRRQRLELHDVASDRDPDGGDVIITLVNSSSSDPGADAVPVAFCQRFAADPSAFDPLSDGLAFMQDMRRQRVQFEQGPPRHVVGGHVRHARITRDGVTSAIIHRWPDRIGEPISIEDHNPFDQFDDRPKGQRQ